MAATRHRNRDGVGTNFLLHPAPGRHIGPCVGHQNRNHALFGAHAGEVHASSKMIGVANRDHAHAVGLGPAHRFFDGPLRNHLAHAVLPVEECDAFGVFDQASLCLGFHSP